VQALVRAVLIDRRPRDHPAGAGRAAGHQVAIGLKEELAVVRDRRFIEIPVRERLALLLPRPDLPAVTRLPEFPPEALGD